MNELLHQILTKMEVVKVEFGYIVSDFRPNSFCSKSAEMKILSYKMDMGITLYEINFFDLCSKKFELMLLIHLGKRGFVIFLQGPTFWDFIDSRVLNYIPSGIRICFPLFWGILLVLGPSPIK